MQPQSVTLVARVHSPVGGPQFTIDQERIRETVIYAALVTVVCSIGAWWYWTYRAAELADSTAVGSAPSLVPLVVLGVAGGIGAAVVVGLGVLLAITKPNTSSKPAARRWAVPSHSSDIPQKWC